MVNSEKESSKRTTVEECCK